ncbi:Outer membrane protein YfgL, lipoprotein component of the protein assembly complex (forms a complex with YaeT, YfiO, and NlpB) [hydrothermal vent metagenome]|uniref:Outer membrane protein YfgL, lipoprotein component of the protein assembly complex (Forms a complex with YaeT, YfiO, and NlpB) n=1 Tax=hydrothermal vent metagenome TaxID=652676 RepID=A0A3B0XB76_9ZZZZ
MTRYFFIIVLASTLLACGDSDNTEPPAELVDFEPSLEVNELWSVDTGAGVEQLYVKLFPLILEKTIVVTDREGRVSAYNSEDGSELWQTELNIVVSGGVGGDEDHLVVTSRNGNVYLLDSKGELLWNVDASSEVLMPAEISAEQIIIRSVDGRISALALQDGSEKWSYKRDVPALTLRGNSSPLIKQGYIFNGLDNGRLVALDLLDGHSVFDIPVATPAGRSELERLVDIDGHSTIVDDTLYMASYQGKVVSIDIRRGQLNWSRKLSTYSGVEHSYSGLFLSDDKDHIWALEASNGATLWKQEKLQSRGITRPVVMGKALVVADFEGYIHWLSAFDGHFLARIDTDDSGVIVPPVVHNERLYIITRDGELSAFEVKAVDDESESDKSESDEPESDE